MSMPKFNSKSTCAEVLAGVNVRGKVVMVTGTTSGIGVATATSLASAGAHVIMANRNIELSIKQIEAIKAEQKDAKIDLVHVDLSSLHSVTTAVRAFEAMNLPLHILILNAGVFSPNMKTTMENVESTFGVNHLAHTHLVRLLMPVLMKSVPSRIVILSSASHAHTGLRVETPLETKLAILCPPADTNVIAYKLYAASKLCNLLMVRKLHRLHAADGISAYAVHPGACIPTNIGRTYGIPGRLFMKVASLFTKSLAQGAATTVLCATRPELEYCSGKYWQDCKESESSADAISKDEAVQDALYDRTLEMLNNLLN